MKKYISPEVALIKELSNDFCEGLEASVTDSKQMGYVQLESVEDDMEDQKNVNAFFGDINSYMDLYHYTKLQKSQPLYVPLVVTASNTLCRQKRQSGGKESKA